MEEQRVSWEILDAFARRSPRPGIPKIDEFNRGDNEGCGFPRQPDEGRAAEHVAGVSESGDEPSQSDGDDRRAGAPPDVRRAALHRSRIRPRWPGRGRDRARRNDPRRRQHRIAADPATVRRRAGRPAAAARHSGAARDAGRRREPAGPSAAADGVPGEERRHAEPAGAQLFGKAAMGLEYAALPVRTADHGAGHWAVSRALPEHATANVEFHMQPLSLDKFGDPLIRSPRSRRASATCGRHRAATCGSRARIRAPHRSSTPGYLSTDEDRKVAIDSLAPHTPRRQAARARAV